LVRRRTTVTDARSGAKRIDPALQPAVPTPSSQASLPSSHAGELGVAVTQAGDNIGTRPTPTQSARLPQPALPGTRPTKTSAG
jgi:hypothetical protein